MKAPRTSSQILSHLFKENNLFIEENYSVELAHPQSHPTKLLINLSPLVRFKIYRHGSRSSLGPTLLSLHAGLNKRNLRLFLNFMTNFMIFLDYLFVPRAGNLAIYILSISLSDSSVNSSVRRYALMELAPVIDSPK